ncbi:phosphatidylglycerol lysyltransferase [Rhizobium sp. RU35A]|uniref:Bifunctional lysylphosphatidylglycerol flippase/synthetase MprF n=1 Tax=Rhizobium straminoryzae TaxID=1387186 RepID=A0A549TC58_9HYPH|nr:MULTISPECIES: phosphatidylglycerol lysyltransferase domain-containing protein [Rhizobium]TRL39434.1 bifunctional lysylphosphatidylglycerol flippase/synthetase MprF [Rhizobium straminoryzae]SIP96572.1 phosphatidylglycerol lysyltransferase [Rhizobium sp. RU35A]
MEPLSADRDLIMPTLPGAPTMARISALWQECRSGLRDLCGLVSRASLLALVAAVVVCVYMEEILLALRLVGAPAIGHHTGTTLSLTLIAGAWAGRRMMQPERRRSRRPSASDLATACEILARQPNASAGLVRLGDKQLLFSAARDAFIMYAVQGKSQVALFDPVGPQEAWPELVRAFADDARRHGRRAVFYQVSPAFLPMAVDCDLRPYKLGEQAVVDLTRFSMKGGEWLKLRRSINRAERDGLEFSLLTPQEVLPLLGELRQISDAWLAAHNAAEKGFSLGTFQNGYLAESPVALVRFQGRIVAFANLLTASSTGDAFIDLMRHIPGTHRGLMDFLFVRLMETLKDQGFRTLNLGMAPLAGLPTHQGAPLWNHVCRQVFENGERFYNFQGVLAFKSKFDPAWEPRYLAVGGLGLPVASMLDVTLLIAGGLKGVLHR